MGDGAIQTKHYNVFHMVSTHRVLNWPWANVAFLFLSERDLDQDIIIESGGTSKKQQCHSTICHSAS